ncbi:MAG: hypothetical protein JSS09_07075, partial [Verrucomicrobia bacterium]|nr:hypothetical protein [Verrucomicrobiota bacterium]
MHPITPSIPEFEGHISKKKHSEDLTISIKAPGLKKSITIQAKLSPPEQPIRSNSYTKIHLKDLADGSVSELYIETSKIQALISKSGSSSPSNLPPPPPSESAVSANTVLYADLEPTSA